MSKIFELSHLLLSFPIRGNEMSKIFSRKISAKIRRKNCSYKRFFWKHFLQTPTPIFSVDRPEKVRRRNCRFSHKIPDDFLEIPTPISLYGKL